MKISVEELLNHYWDNRIEITSEWAFKNAVHGEDFVYSDGGVNYQGTLYFDYNNGADASYDILGDETTVIRVEQVEETVLVWRPVA